MDLLLIVVLLLLVVFMFWNSRKRMKKMKEEQEQKARQTVPGVEVMLQSGIFGTIVSYDADDLDQPAEIEIAPGTVIKVHTQAIARIVTPAEVEESADELAALPADIVVPDSPAGLTPETTVADAPEAADTVDAAEPKVSFEAEEPNVSFDAEPAADQKPVAAENADLFSGTEYDATEAPRYEGTDEANRPVNGGDKQD